MYELLISNSIVAVPGLGSHAFGTWKGDSHEMWLRDFLPKEPVLKDRLRVLIFGYDSALQKNSSTNSFGDYARNMLCVLNVFRSHEKVGGFMWDVCGSNTHKMIGA